MLVYTIRTAVASTVIAGAVASVLAGTASADSDVTYYYQGTGPTVAASQDIKDQATANGGSLVDMSVDKGWRADFRPVQGQDTADQSVASGIRLGAPGVRQDLADGKQVTIEGFSLGSLAAGDLAKYLASEGVDISDLHVTLISDGHMENTGALIVLQPLKPLLDVIGITSGPRAVPLTGTWTFICLEGDGVCDTPDPLHDPIGALDALVGYVTKHGGLDKVYNYSNLDQLSSTTYVNGNVTTVVYHAPRAITRLAETALGGSNELTRRLDTILDKLTTSTGDAGQVKQYKALPEVIRDVVSVTDPQAPLLPTTVDQVSTYVGETAATVYEQAAPRVANTLVTGVTGNPVAGYVAERVAEPVVATTAPIVQDLVTAGTQTALTNSTKPVEDAINRSLAGTGITVTLPPHLIP